MLRSISASKIQKFTIATLVIIALLLASLFPHNSAVNAQSVRELQNKSDQLQAEISANNARIKELRNQAQTLQGKIAQLNAEIDQANIEIQYTNAKLEELRVRLEQTQAELERQKGLLKAALRALYERRGASTVELLMASESFSQFISNQEYLDRLQSSVKDSTEEVIRLKQQIEEEKLAQQELLKRQEEQRNVLNAKQQEQQTLLSQTQGEESRYRAIVTQQQKELEEAEAALARLLAAGNFVPLGPVSRGQVIGSVGSTGYSTGAHLHFMTRLNGSTTNPGSGPNSLINGYSWPVPNYLYISTPYGNVPCQDYTGCYPPGSSYSVFHSGLDIAANYYSPVVAAADGEVVFRGCSSGLGYVVVVDHGGGWQTWYPHMVTPSGQTSGYC